MDQERLDFVGKHHRRVGAARRLGAMVAPIASHGGAVIDDPSPLHVPSAVLAWGYPVEQELATLEIVEEPFLTGA